MAHSRGRGWGGRTGRAVGQTLPPAAPGRRHYWSPPGGAGHLTLQTFFVLTTPLRPHHVSILRMGLCNYTNKTSTTALLQIGIIIVGIVTNGNCAEVVLRNTMRLLP